MNSISEKSQAVKRMIQYRHRIRDLETQIKKCESHGARLLELEQERSTYFNKMKRGFMVLDHDRVIRRINPAACRLLQVDEKRILNRTWPWKGLVFVQSDGMVYSTEKLPWEVNPNRFSNVVTEIGIYSGSLFLLWATMEVESTPDGMLIVFDDRTHDRETEQQIRQREEKYRTIFENIQDVYFEISMDGFVTELSPSIKKICGIGAEDLIGTSIDPYFVEAREQMRLMDLIMSEQHIEDEQVWLKCKHGHAHACAIMATMIRNEKGIPVKIVGSLRDITRRVQAEIQLQKDLEEKEILLREIHHRVKNNMAIITSLLNIQDSDSASVENKEVFHDLRNRIVSMSLVHEHLYMSDHLDAIFMPDYLKSLVRKIIDSYQASALSVRETVDIEPVSMKISTALYCGLIVNELVSNTMKYAFPGHSADSQIQIKLKKTNQVVELEIADNGTGLPREFDWERARTMGLKLVSVLSREQLGGDIRLKRGKGTHFIIKFSVGE